MFTNGVGALVDLPNFSVLIRGLDDWNFEPVKGLPNGEPIAEPRLLDAVRYLKGQQVTELRPAPWLEETAFGSDDPATRTGVPTMPFPSWLRCTACNELASVADKIFGFENNNQNRPHDARFFHDGCTRKKSGKKPLAVPARFVLACTSGHLDDFPYRMFVHRGASCTKATHPRMQMHDRGGNLGANVQIRCLSCGEERNMREAMGERGAENLPRCRGRHPHLSTFRQGGCDVQIPPKVLVIGASNQWFAQTLSALSVPASSGSELDTLVEKHWDALVRIPFEFYSVARDSVPVFKLLDKWTDDEIAAAVEKHRAAEQDSAQHQGYPDLRTAEWEAFTADDPGEASADFTLFRSPDGVPTPLKEYYSDVVQVERLREVRALIGFTRLDSPDPEDPNLITPAPLARDRPTWVPGSEVRGEGMFLRVSEDVLDQWRQRVVDSEAMRRHRDAYGQFRRNRYSDRVQSAFDPMEHWPGERYIALHTLSHLLIRTIALECGYSSASLSERIYAGTDDDPQSGILIYTAVPDSEGTLGGLVSQAEPEQLVRITRRALRDAMRCSADPLCAERLPQTHADFLHGAACHVCLFVSETTCERGNRFLDRRFVVPVGDRDLALFPGAP
jgi:hypothetical protein